MLNNKPPRHLSKESKKIWQNITEGWVMEMDGLVLLQVALEAWDRIQAARAEVDRDGLIITDPSGRRRPHPGLQIEKDQKLVLLKAWRQLGLDIEPPGAVGRPAGR
jgi:P27 family predicted phage terminase small subunit